MTKLIVIGAIVIGIAGVGVVLWLRSGPDASQFADLANPRFTYRDDQRMLVVEAVGDPNVVAGEAFKRLFAAYYKTPGISRRQTPPAPRARWRLSFDTPRTQWVGHYALPVSRESTASSEQAEAGWHVGIETWEYGDVAEVLHIGPYSDEEADISRLHTFIARSGRRVVGEHEEEYVRGPGMIFAGDPRKYLTIIRLRVAPAIAEPKVD